MIITKRPTFLLLEVLIAFTFVVSAFFPLVYPHYYIYQQQRHFIDKIEMDMAVNNFYAAILVQLQRNKIHWQQIEERTVFTVDESIWQELDIQKSIPFLGSYFFAIKKQKKNERYGLYLVELTLLVRPKNSPNKPASMLTYKYEIFMTQLFSK